MTASSKQTLRLANAAPECQSRYIWSTMTTTPESSRSMTAGSLNRFGTGHLPALIGLTITSVSPQAVESRLEVRRELMAPNGFLHAASVIALADTSCGYGCVANLPEGASGFTTIELKTNFLGTARQGQIRCEARALHLGRTTQVWDVKLTDETGRLITVSRCTVAVAPLDPQ